MSLNGLRAGHWRVLDHEKLIAKVLQDRRDAKDAALTMAAQPPVSPGRPTVLSSTVYLLLINGGLCSGQGVRSAAKTHAGRKSTKDAA